ncbi:hypothetical protein BCD49_17440 [Pseudofrankia sp. EUN1h]|nr:hypothetical protein BCD49_17440 [Pseudofrankia sp. EUN1h]
MSPVVASKARAMPKSMTRAPDGDSRMLAGFRSRWTRPAAWIAVSAEAIATPSRSSSAAGMGPRSRTAAASVGPSMYSVTR